MAPSGMESGQEEHAFCNFIAVLIFLSYSFMAFGEVILAEIGIVSGA